MSFAKGARVVLVRGIHQVTRGSYGTVKRSNGFVVIVAFDNWRTVPVDSEKLEAVSSNDQSDE